MKLFKRYMQKQFTSLAKGTGNAHPVMNWRMSVQVFIKENSP